MEHEKKELMMRLYQYEEQTKKAEKGKPGPLGLLVSHTSLNPDKPESECVCVSVCGQTGCTCEQVMDAGDMFCKQHGW